MNKTALLGLVRSLDGTGGYDDYALNRLGQAIDFFDDVTDLRACLLKEIELLNIEAKYVDEHLKYYNPAVAESRRAEAKKIREFLDAVAGI